jgi:type VI secretion system secreted protein Hcp
MPLECALYYSNGITGSNSKGGREDSSVVIEFDHMVYSPVDTHSGSMTGARVHGPVMVTKEIDKASPLLYKAATTGETLSELRVEWFRITPEGVEEMYYKHTLRNVKVTSVEEVLPNTKDPALERQTHLEKLKLMYEEIEWEFVDGGLLHMDTWRKGA